MTGSPNQFISNTFYLRFDAPTDGITVPIIMSNQLFGFSLFRSRVLRAFIAPAPVPSAVMDHMLM